MHEPHDIEGRDAGREISAGPLVHADDDIESQRTASPPQGHSLKAAQLRRTWSTRALLATGLLSFLGGILAWHIVGFWSFVSTILYNPDGAETAISAPLTIEQQQVASAVAANQAPASASRDAPAAKSAKAESTITGAHRPPANADTLAELLQCAEALKGETQAIVHACPPLRQRLPMAQVSTRGNRQLDAREAARRLATGWQTGIATIETGTLPDRP